MSLEKKLQIPRGGRVRLLNPPEGFHLEAPAAEGSSADAVILFAKNGDDLKHGEPVFDAARKDRLAWIAYPKSGQLETDLDRDKLAARVKPLGIRVVRIVSIDGTWSAMRFRPDR
jgi:hypothetical protein